MVKNYRLQQHSFPAMVRPTGDLQLSPKLFKNNNNVININIKFKSLI